MRAKELVVPVIAALLCVLPVAAIAQGTSSASMRACRRASSIGPRAR
jgi:uncharacterized membrane protein